MNRDQRVLLRTVAMNSMACKTAAVRDPLQAKFLCSVGALHGSDWYRSLEQHMTTTHEHIVGLKDLLKLEHGITCRPRTCPALGQPTAAALL